MDTKSRKYTRRNARTRIADLLREALQLVDKHCVASGTTLMPKTPLTLKTKLTPVVERAEEYTPLPNSTTLETSSSEDFSEPIPLTPLPNITPMNSFATPAPPATPAPATPKTSARKYNPKWNEFVKQYMKEQKDLGRELKRPEALFEIKELGLYESNKRTTRKTRTTPGRLSPPSNPNPNLNPERV